MRPVIHSNKHYVQMSLSTVLTGVRSSVSLINALALDDVNTPPEVGEGAIVKAVFVELWTISSANDGFEIVTITKVPEGGAGPTFAQMSLLNDYTNKKNILFTHQGLQANDGVGQPVRVPIGWVKIPKSKQRFGLGDNLILSISNPGANTTTFCGFSTFKEYT